MNYWITKEQKIIIVLYVIAGEKIDLNIVMNVVDVLGNTTIIVLG